MNKTLKQKTINDKVYKLTDNSFDRKFYKLQPVKYIVFQDYTAHPYIFESFFELDTAQALFDSIIK